MIQGTSKQLPDLYASVTSGPILLKVAILQAEECRGQSEIGDVRRRGVLSVSVVHTIMLYDISYGVFLLLRVHMARLYQTWCLPITFVLEQIRVQYVTLQQDAFTSPVVVSGNGGVGI